MTVKELKQKLSTALVNIDKLPFIGITAAISIGSTGQLISECLEAEITLDDITPAENTPDKESGK
jgi:hypothetical protein